VRALVLLLILLLAMGLRFYRLDAQSFWNDEGNAAAAAQRTIPLVLRAAAGDIHPPGYYLLLHFWHGLVGRSEFALRSLSVLCSVLTVALTYRLGRRLAGSGVGLGGALLAALSPLAIYYAQEARMYALLGLLAVASTDALCGLFHVRSPKSALLAYVLTSAAGMYTHYAFPFVLVVHNLLFAGWWLTRGRRGAGRWRRLLSWAGVQAAIGLLFLPWLPTALRAVTTWPSAGRGYELGPALRDVFRVLTVGTTLELDAARWGLWIAGGLLLVGLWPGRKGGAAVGVLAVWLLVPVTLIFAFDLYKPAYLKFLLAVLPPFHLLVARGVEGVSRIADRVSPIAYRLSRIAYRRSHGLSLTQHATRNAKHVLRFACYVLIILVGFLPSLRHLYFDPAYARDDYRQIAADVAAMARPGDGIILNAPNQWEVFSYYHRDGAPVYPLPRSRPPDVAAVTAELEAIAAAHRRLLVIYWGDTEADPQRIVESWLAAHAYPAGDRWYGRVRFAVYGLGALPEQPAVESGARFGEAITLAGYSVGAGPFAPGEVLPVSLFWEADAAPPERYKVFVHLLDGGGNLVAQHDAEPLGNLLPTTLWAAGEALTDRHGVLLPSDLPAGSYTLVVGLYRLSDGTRLAVTDGETVADSLPLGSVTVGP